MRKNYILKNLGCAHCAEKMERAVGKIKGVHEVSITFMTQKMYIEADDASFENIIEEASKAINKIEKDVEIVEV